jgi:hypothetical protein
MAEIGRLIAEVVGVHGDACGCCSEESESDADIYEEMVIPSCS